jgi:hypothetical protein
VHLSSDVLDGELCFNTAGIELPASMGNWDGVMEDVDEDVDMDYAYRSDVVDEAYEYDSGDNTSTDPIEGREDKMDLGDEDLSDGTSEADETNDLYTKLKSVTMPTNLATTESLTSSILPGSILDTANDSDSDDTEDFSERYRKSAQKEHFAGEGCIHARGYSGYRIRAEEMKGCNILQCLFRKERTWSPEADDQPFELEGNYYLSGLSGHVPSRDYGSPQYPVERHNHGDDRHPDDTFYSVSTSDQDS